MTTALDTAFNAGDPQGLSALRGEAARNADSPDVRRAVAQQFEALFLGLMLKEMRSASVIKGGLIDNDRLSQSQSLFDEQLALNLARGRGTGLTDSIMRALGEPASRPQSPTEQFAARTRVHAGSRSSFTDQLDRLSQAARTTQSPFSGTPEDFVEKIWPHAERAAARLGTTPDVLVAQAALETGWGRHMFDDGEGRTSFNVFGVKAGSNWDGPRRVVPTLEFVQGVAEQRREPFRVYSDLAEGFDDYVTLVQGPRYREAQNAQGPEDYIRALQRAGYATDPDYADKVLSILDRGLPGRAGGETT